MKPQQLSLGVLEPEMHEMPKPKAPRFVRATSRAQVKAADGFKGRRGRVWKMLNRYWETYDQPPTASELTAWQFQGFWRQWSVQERAGYTLDTRRGLHDLLTAGVVEAVPHGKRICNENGTLCETWRIRQR